MGTLPPNDPLARPPRVPPPPTVGPAGKSEPSPRPLGSRVFTPPPRVESLSLGDAFSRGWTAMSANYGVLVAASFVSLLMIVVASLTLELVPYVGSFLDVLVSGPAMAGMMFLGVRLARGENAGFETMFDGFRRYLPVLGIAVVRMVLLYACFIPLAVVLAAGVAWGPGGRPSAGIVIGMVLAGVLGLGLAILIGVRLWFAECICLDPRLNRPGAVASIKASWQLTGLVFWPLLGLGVVAILVYIGSILLLCVGLPLLGLPLLATVTGAAYDRVVGPPDPNVCQWCGYDLRGSPTDVCPECGNRHDAVPAADPAPPRPTDPAVY